MLLPSRYSPVRRSEPSMAVTHSEKLTPYHREQLVAKASGAMAELGKSA